jgi:hypothetical protein
MQKLLTILFFISSCITLCSCGSSSKPYNQIIAYKYSKFNHELQLKYHVIGRGNVHQLSLSKYEYDRSDWIYLNSLKGKIDADSLILTNYQRMTDYPWKQENLKGYIQILNDTTIKLNLQLPFYNDNNRITSYAPYEFNGTYKLEIRQDTTGIIDKDFYPELNFK